MKLSLVAYIKEIQIEIVPGWKDLNHGGEVIFSKQTLPALFLMGKQWTVKHKCSRCDEFVVTSRHTGSFEVNEENFFQWGYLIESRMSIDNMNSTASVFKNLKEKKRNDRRSYVLKGNDNEIGEVLADVFHYKCHNCNSKYLATYCYKFGEDGDGGGKVEPNYVYIEEIACVDFNESVSNSAIQ